MRSDIPMHLQRWSARCRTLKSHTLVMETVKELIIAVMALVSQVGPSSA